MRKGAWVVTLLVAAVNSAGVALALLTPSTGDGMGDAIEMHFRFAAFSLLGVLVALGFLLVVVFQWKRVSKPERVTAFVLLAAPVFFYFALVLLGAFFPQ